jgi:hypothetical protein
MNDPPARARRLDPDLSTFEKKRSLVDFCFVRCEFRFCFSIIIEYYRREPRSTRVVGKQNIPESAR